MKLRFLAASLAQLVFTENDMARTQLSCLVLISDLQSTPWCIAQMACMYMPD